MKDMKATARRSTRRSFSHNVDIRRHNITVDELPERAGEDEGPSPQELLAASLATCTAITMEMYAKRKGWDIGQVEVGVDYTPAERGCPTKFTLDLRLPKDITPEQRERLQVIAAKCPIHRTLEGEVMFEDKVSLIEPGEAPTEPPRHDLRRRALNRVAGRAAL
jgi:putative redox protein